ncbi:GntR family transcriptional regulator [Klebsiella pneumoniae BIDMC 25]|nr:GntR family transcriptional regulator [Klebsiella pneumoniae BIDMC 25]STV84163.1 GntR family transcriptional regulator [Klebsiella pneumoniae]
MSARRFGTQSLVRLLGNWQETSSRTPLWRQLAEALRLLILDGRLTLQTRLPGERELAAALNVSRTTIASALGQLREEGFLYSRQGSGSRIVLPERPADLPLPAGISSTLNLSTAALSAGPEVHQAFQHAMTLLPPYLAQTGYDQQGLPVLREAIARRYSERGLPTRPDEVMVVNGALSAFALILRLFTGPGDRVVIDAPTYPMAISAIQGASCRPVGVALPQQGWDCDGLAATIAQTAPRLAWLMPDFHNPTGRCMDAPTRQRVADIAARTRTTLVIDETMADLWYNAPPPPPLASFNPDAAVLTIGSAGKSFWGGTTYRLDPRQRADHRLAYSGPRFAGFGYAAAGATGLQLATGKCRHTAAAAAGYAQGAPGHVRNADGGIFSPLAVFATGRWALFLGGTS